MSFWSIFIGCLIGASAATLACVVLLAVGWVLINLGGLIYAIIEDALEEWRRRR